MTYTALFQAVRGYDEFYDGWGLEDDDLVQRFAYLGLRPRGPGQLLHAPVASAAGPQREAA